VVRETRAVLRPLEDEIGLTPAELIEEPVFCEYAPENQVNACVNAVETARLAGLDFRIAEARAQRLELAAQADAGRERVAELSAQAEANRAVLAVLQQIAAEEAGQSRLRLSGS